MQQSHTRLALQLQSIRQFISRWFQHLRQFARLGRPPVSRRRDDRPEILPPSPIPSARPTVSGTDSSKSSGIPPKSPPAEPSFDPASFDNFDSSSPDGSHYPPVQPATPQSRVGGVPHENQPQTVSTASRNGNRPRNAKAKSHSRRHPAQSRHHQIDWVIPGKLAVGSLPRSPMALTLSEHRIKVILSVCPESEGHLPNAIRQGFRCLRVPLTDSRSITPLDPFDLGEAVDLIQWNLNKQLPVYVHCLAGMERSPTVCLAYLCRYQQFDLLDALGWLRHVHPATRITGAQLSSVRHYLQGLGPQLPIATDGLSGI